MKKKIKEKPHFDISFYGDIEIDTIMNWLKEMKQHNVNRFEVTCTYEDFGDHEIDGVRLTPKEY